MSLAVGTRLGAFEIAGKLGAGGMGEVWRATDTKLGREVAIKTLPASLAGDRDRLARFDREAKLLASLNHANIAAVHSLDETDGTLYIAMELVEGQSLEQRLAAGPIPLDEALEYGLQIASALEAAHEKGVVHRDLKPANIMLTPNGTIKVLDFGLAKAFAGNPHEASPAHSPALSMAMTQQGLVLGTAGYMSPEQASGQATDQRADIWAFGVVMYEMLTGQPLFSGESVPHILADVLRADPDWDRLPANLHPRLKLMLARCLEKKPRDRYAGIADVRVDIERVLRDPEGAALGLSAASPAQAMPARGKPLTAVGAAVAGAALVAIAGWLLWPPPPAPGSVIRFSIPLAEGEVVTTPLFNQVAISPDGTQIAYVANNRIQLRSLAEPEARPIVGGEGDNQAVTLPTFSPDGQWLAFVRTPGITGPFTIYRLPVSGGARVPIYEAAAFPDFPQGLSWPDDEWLLFTTADGVVRMPANGGATEVLVPRQEGERFFSPQVLPGGESVLFTRIEGELTTAGAVSLQNAQIAIQSIGGDDRSVVWNGGSASTYLPTGHLVYAQGAALFAIPLDLETRSVRGGPVPMVQDLRRPLNVASDAAHIAWSATGTLVSIPGRPGPVAEAGVQTTLSWLDRSGRAEPLPVRPDDYTAARISPDGTKIALVIGSQLARGTVPAIWLYNLTTGNLSQLTADARGDDGPVWAGDSRHLFFRSLREAGAGIWSIDVETGETTLVAAANSEFPGPMPWSLSADERTLAVVNGTRTTAQIAALDLDSGELRNLLDDGTFQSEPAISPDGSWIAYMQNIQSEARELNIRPYPDAARTRIPLGRGGTAVFSRDGAELFYSDFENLLSVPVDYSPTLRVGQPQTILSMQGYIVAGAGRAWDVDPSGERFLLIRAPGGPQTDSPAEQQRLDVVLNWFEELKRRVPVE